MMLVLLTGGFGGAAVAGQQGPAATPAANPATTDYGAAPSTPLAWLELGPDGAQIARAITGESGCPTLTADGTAWPMDTRAASDGDFPVTTCEATIPAGTKSAAVGDTQLHLLDGAPKRIAVIGDTGCRLATTVTQGCDDPTLWPFVDIAKQVADWHPDLIIHVGDYYYRETPCPAGNVICAGSPSGDNWASWNADFFTPAAPALSSAPWVFVRGNHEMCDRGGNGWFHFLDPRAMPSSCPTYTDPYAVPIGDVNLLVFDSSAASDGSAPEDQVKEYTRELGMLPDLAGDNGAWFLTHRPIWGIVQFGKDRTLATGTIALQTAAAYTLPASVQLSLAGHIHLAEVLSFPQGSGRAPMFIMGTSGTELDQPVTVDMAGINIGGVPTASGRAASIFGYMTMEPVSGIWTATTRNASGTPLWTCTVYDKAAGCAP